MIKLLKYLIVTLNNFIIAFSFIGIGALFFSVDKNFDADTLKQFIFCGILLIIGCYLFLESLKEIFNFKQTELKFNYMFKTEIRLTKILKKHKIIFAIILIQNLAVILFSVIEFHFAYLKNFLKPSVFHSKAAYYFLMLTIIFYIYGIAFILIGEVLQNLYGERKRPFIADFLIDILLLTPFIISLSVLATAYILADKKSEKLFMKALVFMKYFTYFNMVQIAYDDHALLFSINKIRLDRNRNRKIIKNIDEKSISMMISLVFFGIMLILNSFYRFPEYTTAVVYFTALTIILNIIYHVFAEQMLMYKYFLNEKKIRM